MATQAIQWTRTHSLRVELPLHNNADMATIKRALKALVGVTGCDSTKTVLTVGFAHKYNPKSLRRGPYRQVRRLLIEHGIITNGTRAASAA